MDAVYYNNIKGYLARPENPNGAGVVLIHEFWGLNQQVKNTADKIAEAGFTVLALDLYDGKSAKTKAEAQKLKESIVIERAMKNIEEALDYLLKQYSIPLTRSAVWGFCFGGGIAFQAAVYPITMGATIIYYGPVDNDTGDIEKIKNPLLGVFGAEDHAIKIDFVKSFHKTLDDLKIQHEIFIYPDAGHAFANETRDTYHEVSAKDAWSKTISFLNKYLVHGKQ